MRLSARKVYWCLALHLGVQLGLIVCVALLLVVNIEQNEDLKVLRHELSVQEKEITKLKQRPKARMRVNEKGELEVTTDADSDTDSGRDGR